jgi:hypothetical protein
MQLVKRIMLSLGLLASTLVVAAPDAKPVAALPATPAGPGNAAVPVTDSVIQQTTRPGGQLVPEYCQNMTPAQCQQMQLQKEQKALTNEQQLSQPMPPQGQTIPQ